ncbi:zinc dependent phospholipase C family protein [Paenibacillus alkalitolerans]|uniref:zinc dependent phospholipase C family protein n=1 Tax=Paenibacillus alkalitolerans TaxID=2799335 RepID=UPI0018F701A3|nr:zinc dependent phospholipase C family protein [Paenibacillus alkalitolerans]
MPNVWTHFIWGEEVFERLGITNKVLKNPAAANLFRFGCQGPDLLFYHRFYPWMKGKAAAANRLGSLLHKSRCGAFLRSLLGQCEGLELDDPKTVYVLGFIGHHVLDRNAHPFVFARQGSRSRDHQRLEVALDTLVTERYMRLDTRRTPVAPYLDSGPNLPAGVSEALTAAAKETYPESAVDVHPGLWNESYRDMLAAMRLFHDPFGVKRALTGGAIEPFVPGRRKDPADAANERRSAWAHPSDGSNTSQDTFWDVWNRSIADGEQVIGAAAGWVEAPAANKQEAWQQFTEALSDLSYETGLACED